MLLGEVVVEYLSLISKPPVFSEVVGRPVVQVRKNGNPIKYKAILLYVSHEQDLAILTIQDSDFWIDLKSLEIGEMPLLRDNVYVVGYPKGGDTISITKGVISRIDIRLYAHSSIPLIVIQIDAAINSGNSGGPVMKDEKVVGIAFQVNTEKNTQNIGYVIPICVFNHFINSISLYNKFVGIGWLGLVIQKMENTSIQEYYKMNTEDKKLTGVKVKRMNKLTDVFNKLKIDDIILSIDGNDIAVDGTIEFRKNERIAYTYITSMKYPNDKCSLKILRQGQILNIDITLANIKERYRLCPRYIYDYSYNQYYIYCGLIFCTTSYPYFQCFGKYWESLAPSSFSNIAEHPGQEYQDQEIVILSRVIVSDVTLGYYKYANKIVLSVNGINIKNLKHLINVITTTKDKYINICFNSGTNMVLDTKLTQEHDKVILTSQNISKNCYLWNS